YVDRMSINLELPSEEGLKLVAPEKDHASVRKPLAIVDSTIQEIKSESALVRKKPLFVPAGQSTQMVIGATPENDYQSMSISDEFYKNYHLKRVYYSGYIPINDSHKSLPQI